MQSGKHYHICITVWLLCLLAVCASALGAIWPQEVGKTGKNGLLEIDQSNSANGYILAKVNGKENRYKLRISDGEMTYTYDIKAGEDYEVFPLQMGSGSYSCVLYKNTSGKKYTQAGHIKLQVKMPDENNVFLCPNQYVDYSADSPAVEMAAQLCEGLKNDTEKVKAVRNFMRQGFVYDYVAALTVQEAYLSDVDGCFASRKGLCQDLAAVAACMLRSQGIPTQLVIGHAGSIYHAWNRVLIDGEFRRLDITADLSGMGKDTVYTAERYY